MANSSKVSLGLIWLCAAGGLASTLYMGRRNPSALLIGMFVAWELAPFVGMTFLARRGSATRVLPIALTSLAVYGYAAFGHSGLHGAFLYLVVPFVSWAAIGVLLRIGQARN